MYLFANQQADYYKENNSLKLNCGLQVFNFSSTTLNLFQGYRQLKHTTLGPPANIHLQIHSLKTEHQSPILASQVLQVPNDRQEWKNKTSRKDASVRWRLQNSSLFL